MRDFDFYRAVAQVSFTLLGLWWIVAQFRHEDWVRTAPGRRLAYDISLFFLLPGLMSLLSLLSDGTTEIWRIGFAAVAAAGALEAAAWLRYARVRRAAPVVSWIFLGSAAVYVAIVIVAVAGGAVEDALGLRPLQVEGILISVMMFLGVNLAWLVLSEPSRAGS